MTSPCRVPTSLEKSGKFSDFRICLEMSGNAGKCLYFVMIGFFLAGIVWILDTCLSKKKSSWIFSFSKLNILWIRLETRDKGYCLNYCTIVNRVKLTTKKDKRFLNCNAKMWQLDNFCLEKQYTFQRFVWKNHIPFSPKVWKSLENWFSPTSGNHERATGKIK